jgi:hypothetical protein
MDYFKEVIYKINSKKQDIEILNCDIQIRENDYSFELFKFGISDKIKKIYNSYSKIILEWECQLHKIYGFVNLVSYEKILSEHTDLCEEVAGLENGLIEEQDKVLEDILHWYPVFIFPNGDKFCYDDRNGKIVFYEHEVFDCGINLHGLVIAESIDVLLENWSKVLFMDIYDWYEGVNEGGIDIKKEVYKPILQMIEKNGLE